MQKCTVETTTYYQYLKVVGLKERTTLPLKKWGPSYVLNHGLQLTFYRPIVRVYARMRLFRR